MITAIADAMEWAFCLLSPTAWLVVLVVLTGIMLAFSAEPFIFLKLFGLGVLLYLFLRFVGWILPDAIENLVVILTILGIVWVLK